MGWLGPPLRSRRRLQLPTAIEAAVDFVRARKDPEDALVSFERIPLVGGGHFNTGADTTD